MPGNSGRSCGSSALTVNVREPGSALGTTSSTLADTRRSSASIATCTASPIASRVARDSRTLASTRSVAGS